MTSVFTRIHIEPKEILKTFSPDNPTNAEEFTSAVRVRFYLSGVTDILALRVSETGGVDYHIPSNSKVQATGEFSAVSIIEKQMDTILEAMRALVIKFGAWFLWDVRAKIILTDESFLEFTPHFQLHNSLFVLDRQVFVDEGEEYSEAQAYCLNTSSAWTLIKLALMLQAKNELYRVPIVTDAGRKALAFLLKSYYGMGADFTRAYAPWDNVPLANSADSVLPPRSSSLGIHDSHLSDIRRLASGAIYAAPASEEEVTEKFSPPDRIFTVSHLVEHGLEGLDFGGDTLIKFVVDILMNVYRAIVYDVTTGVLLIELHVGQTRDDSQVEEELGVDSSVVLFGKLES